MNVRLFSVITVSVFLISGCGPIQSTVFKCDNTANYKEIFRQSEPADVNVVNSIVVKYSYRIGVVTTPDWEIELIAPEKWIANKAKSLYLRKIDDVNSFPYRVVLYRKTKDSPCTWYAPKDISEYDLYYQYMTSAMYIHMLVDKTPVSTDRYRVFLSKH